MNFEVEQPSAELLGSSQRTSMSQVPSSWWQHDDLFLQTTAKEQQQQRRSRAVSMCLLALTTIGFIFSIISLAVSASRVAELAADRNSASAVLRTAATWPQVARIAFSSCTSYDLRPQPIWTEGVIPSKPDAWVWLGDITYMDDPLLDCNQVPTFAECNCTPTFMKRPPFQCFAGDVQHARTRMSHQLSIPEYKAFLDYMCPGYQQTGVFPPWGSEPGMCPRPIFGTYDDHDFGWNNGNGRNPNKHEIKNVYLDGIGEPRDSPRRGSANGLQASYTLPGPGSSSSSSDSSKLVDEIRLVLLDERYFRETLPCSMRSAWCTAILQNSPVVQPVQAGDIAFCQDFLIDGGLGVGGSCCKKDDEWDHWCGQAGSSGHPRWHELCDPTSPTFAQQLVVLGSDNSTVLPLSGDLWTTSQMDLSARLLEATSSPMCEVLGLQQRQWLQEVIQGSRAALNIIASGSVLAGSIGWKEGQFQHECSGDDLGCWQRAQVNLLHTVANGSGCAVIITGDFHYSDLKVIQPGDGSEFLRQLRTDKLKKPVYQVMGSGMTYSTAEHLGSKAQCSGSYKEDLAGLRPLGRCSYVPDPGFSMLEVDWEQRVVSLSVRNHTTGGIAYGYDGSKQLLQFSLDSCKMIS